MRADQWVMLGVVGLGVFAITKLFSASKESEPPPPEGPGPDGFPPLPQDQVALKAGVTYYGRIDYRNPPSATGTATMLRSYGLDGITVFHEARSIPPIHYALDNPSAGTRWFRATAAKTGPRPPGLTYLWIAAT